jgi:carbonic anhydrase
MQSIDSTAAKDTALLSKGDDEQAPDRNFRIWFTKTYGDDHVCLTEIQFFDLWGQQMKATLGSMSSCYGCSQCENCTHRYGDPSVLFDGITDGDDPHTWACTAPGTFSAGVGSQNVVFSLKGKPAFYTLVRPQVNGGWVSRDFSLEEQRSEDGQWWVLSSSENVPQVPNQSINITGAPVPLFNSNGQTPPAWFYEFPESWGNDYPYCLGTMQSPIELNTIDTSAANIGTDKLPYNYEVVNNWALVNTGQTVQVVGEGILGTLTLADGVYEATQFHFHFPAEHRIGGDEHRAVGEVHIVHRKVGSNSTADIAIVVIMLHLPLESEKLEAQEKFFIDMGMLVLPDSGTYTLPFDHNISLGRTFAEQLDGHFWQYTGSLATPPCREGVEYFVMEKPAAVPGVLVLAFREKFKDPPGNARPLQNRNGRPVAVNKLPAAPTDEDV